LSFKFNAITCCLDLVNTSGSSSATSHILQETGDALLLEDGGFLLLDEGISFGNVDEFKVVTTTYQLLVTDETVIGNSSTPFTITLPSPVLGQIFKVKNIGTGAITLDGFGTNTIDGELTQTIAQWECIEVVGVTSTGWGII